MMRLNIPFTDNRELEEIAKVLSTGYFTQGPKTIEFEQKVAEHIECKFAFGQHSTGVEGKTFCCEVMADRLPVFGNDKRAF